MSDVKQVIVVRTDLNMRRDRIAGQAARAAMMFLIDNNESPRGDEIVTRLTPDEAEWLMSGSLSSCIVGCDSRDALEELIFRAELADVEVHSVQSEAHNGVTTLTCAAFGPSNVEELDRIVGNLKPI